MAIKFRNILLNHFGTKGQLDERSAAVHALVHLSDRCWKRGSQGVWTLRYLHWCDGLCKVAEHCRRFCTQLKVLVALVHFLALVINIIVRGKKVKPLEQEICEIARWANHSSRLSKSVFIHPFHSCTGGLMPLIVVFRCNDKEDSARFSSTRTRACTSSNHTCGAMEIDSLCKLLSWNSTRHILVTCLDRWACCSNTAGQFPGSFFSFAFTPHQRREGIAILWTISEWTCCLTMKKTFSARFQLQLESTYTVQEVL